jgi:hypothetical protein
VLNPGTTSWIEAIPVFVVTAALLFVPGAVACRLAGVRLWESISIGPAVSTTTLALSGIAAPVLGLRWSAVTLATGIVLSWALAWVAGRLVRRLARMRLVQLWTPAGNPEPLEHTAPWIPGGRRRVLGNLPWASMLGVTFSFAVVAVSLILTSRTPEAFPQHPDTIFHLGDPQWMLERADISSLHANGYIVPSGTGFYPAAFHGFTATISLLTGAPVVVATSCLVLASTGLAWPLGMFLAARTFLGTKAGYVLATAVTAVAFTGYPYFLMGFGVLWPNLFGQTLLPACLALYAAALGRFATTQSQVTTPPRAALILMTCLPGLALAHPNALVSFGLFAFLITAAAVVGRAWANRRRPLRVTAYLGALAGVTVAAGWLLTQARPSAMLRTGAIGKELPIDEAVKDLVFFAPRGAGYLELLTVVTAVGGLVLVRRRGAGWLVPAMMIMLGLYFLNVAIDTYELRNLTWPWYNNAVRLQAVAILPTSLAAAAGLVAIGHVVGRPLRRFAWGSLAGVVAVLAAFVVATQAYIPEHSFILDRYFHPASPNSWASPGELRALHALAEDIPSDAVVAANPWNGGTYLYVVSGRHLLVPTEKANTAGDRALLSLRLNSVGDDPVVCAAAKRQGVTHAITGGRPFAWVGKRMRLYTGVDAVGSSAAFTKVRTEGPYTLYRMVKCAGA